MPNFGPKLPRELLDRGRSSPEEIPLPKLIENDTNLTKQWQSSSSQRASIPPPPHPSSYHDGPGSDGSQHESVLNDSEDGLHDEDAEPPGRPHVSRITQKRLDQEDADIAALEKKLGLKADKRLPKPFTDDGLDGILGSTGDSDGTSLSGSKRNQTQDDAWLKQKRLRRSDRRQGGSEPERNPQRHSDSDWRSPSSSLSGNGSDTYPEGLTSTGSEDQGIKGNQQRTKARENPYVAPVQRSSKDAAKYIPPWLRRPQSSDDSGDTTRLRRQMQGALNKLSDANLLSIVTEVEMWFQHNPRQRVTTTLIDLLISLFCDSSVLMDTFVILHAGFAAAVYKVIGPDFGAHFVERLVERIDYYRGQQKDNGDVGKQVVNLIALLAQIYHFQVISAALLFDYVRAFLNSLSESNTELLLRLIRSCGQQLRSDDPSSLKEVVFTLHRKTAEVGEPNVSVRTKYMTETITGLKDNRMKTGVAASAVVTEHTIRMKKTLGSLNTRNLKASEPLQVTLDDIHNSDKRGKWWLVSASWRDEGITARGQESNTSRAADEGHSDSDKSLALASDDDNLNDLHSLATNHRMNTTIRRAIFTTLLSSTDCKDAQQRLLKLHLTRSQERQIPSVLLHCAGAEEAYNPFYTLVARRLCKEHKLRMGFQFAAWDLFRKMGEIGDDCDDDDEDDEDEDEGGNRMSLPSVVNHARMYADLIGRDCVSITIFKNLDLTRLKPKTRVFVEVLLVTLLTQSTKERTRDTTDRGKIQTIFDRARDLPDLASGLQWFLRKVVAVSDLPKGKPERVHVAAVCKEGCKRLRQTDGDV